jgi:hypothetical protein
MRDTAHWLFNLAAVLGFMVMGTALFFALVSVWAWLDRRWPRQGYPRSRRFH